MKLCGLDFETANCGSCLDVHGIYYENLLDSPEFSENFISGFEYSANA